MKSLLIATFLFICFGASAQSKEEEVWKRVEALSNAVFSTNGKG
jgi:hypothetical protein